MQMLFLNWVGLYDPLKMKAFDHYHAKHKGTFPTLSVFLAYVIKIYLFFNNIRHFPTEDGDRNFWSVRVVTTTIDANPATLKEATRLLSLDGGVIRVDTIKLKGFADRAQSQNFHNPFLNIK
jgi:hypothetical protein